MTKQDNSIIVLVLLLLVVLFVIPKLPYFAIGMPSKPVLIRMDDSADWSTDSTDAILNAFEDAQIKLTAEVWLNPNSPDQNLINHVSQWQNLNYIEIAQGMYGDVVTGPADDGQPGSDDWSQSEWENYIQAGKDEFPGTKPVTFFCNRAQYITNDGLNAMHELGIHTFDCPAPVPSAQRRDENPLVIYSNDWEESYTLNEGDGTNAADIMASADAQINTKGYANFVFHVWSGIDAADKIIDELQILKNNGYTFMTIEEYYQSYIGEVITECIYGQKKCASNTKYQQCLSNGQWSGLLTCPSGTTCFNGDCITEQPEGDITIGVRSTLFGYQQEEQPSYWVGAIDFVSNKFSPKNPGIIYGIGGIIDEPVGYSYLNFPDPGGNYPNVEFSWSGQDENEAYLDAYDIAGIDVWLQVEPSEADVEDLIELVLDQYGHHSCIIGFGVDVEWLDAPTYPEGRKVTNTEVISWLNKIKSYDSNYKLFLKHWETSMMPDSYPNDVVFINDALGSANLNSMVNEFSNWGNTYSDAEVGFQVGYQQDKNWWDNYADPVQKIGNELMDNIPNMKYYYWVDFSIQDVYNSEVVCAQDVKQCSDGSYVSRNPSNNCEFYDCPVCVPKTCSNLGYECGTWDNTCGTDIYCGSCSSGKVCSGGQCILENICDDTCSSLGFECGTQTICGSSTNCGICLLNEECTNGQCVAIGNGNGGVLTFDLDYVLFKLGGFEVTLLILLLSIGGLFVIKIIMSR